MPEFLYILSKRFVLCSYSFEIAKSSNRRNKQSRKRSCVSYIHSPTRGILISDKGVGVDCSTVEKAFGDA